MPKASDRGQDDREKIQEQILENDKKSLETEKDLLVAEKALAVAIRILSTAVADMPLALASIAASFVAQKTTPSPAPTAPTSPTVTTTAPTPPPPKFTMGNMAGGQLPPPPPPGMGDVMASGAHPPSPPSMGDVMSAGALPPPPTPWMGNAMAAASSAIPPPTPPPPPPPPLTLMESWAKGAKEVGDAIRDAAKDAGKEIAGKIKAVGDALDRAWKNPVGTVAAGVKGAATGAAGVAGDAGGAIGGGLTAVLGKLAMSFGAVIGPMAVLGELISSSASGFQVLSGAVKVLAAVFAPLLLPITVALSVAMIEFADKMQPVIDQIFPAMVDTIMNDVLPALEDFADYVAEISGKNTGAISTMIHYAGNPGELLSDAADEINPFTDKGFAKNLTERREKEKEERRKKYGMEPIEGETPEETKKRIERNRESSKAKGEVLDELRRSVTPKSQTLGVSAAYTTARNAALNTSPFEARILDSVLKAVSGIERVARNTEGRGTPAYGTTGAGDYSDEDAHSGGGGDFGYGG